jgi:UDP-glucose 4-epimerase
MKSWILVTGAAGFIGSHLVERLLNSGHAVLGVDNLQSGRVERISHLFHNNAFEFLQADINELSHALESRNIDAVYHLAADADVRAWLTDPDLQFRSNFEGTYNLLESIRDCDEKIKFLVFASSSSVYGDASILPTPETYGPMMPISLYGASKICGESLVACYAYYLGFKAIILRFGNIIGPGMTARVIFDFVHKLEESPDTLEILGNGNQIRSFIFIDDLLDAISLCTERSREQVGVFNVASGKPLTVLEIARIVADEMGRRKVTLKTTGGIEGGRGWKGDVKEERLHAERLALLGWVPKHSEEEGVRLTVRAIRNELSQRTAS